MANADGPLIYIVDDDPDEHVLLKTVFTRYFADCSIRHFDDGDQLLIQLTHCLDGRLPDLILLDWFMPILPGHQILQLLSQDSKWRSIPVVVRSSVEMARDQATCHRLGAKAFVVKENNYQQLVNSIAALFFEWLD